MSSHYKPPVPLRLDPPPMHQPYYGSATTSIFSTNSPVSPAKGSYRGNSPSIFDQPNGHVSAAYMAPSGSRSRSNSGFTSEEEVGMTSRARTKRTPPPLRSIQTQQRGQTGHARRATSSSPTKAFDAAGAMHSRRSTVGDKAGLRAGPTPPPLPGRHSPANGSRNSPGRATSVYGGGGNTSTYSKRGDRVGSPGLADLQMFAHHCELFFFSTDPPEESRTYISTTLASLPPSHRAAFTRIQSSLRAQSHDHALRLRLSQFHALISSTLPNASLTPLARSELAGARAKTERKDRLRVFLGTWCAKSGNTIGVEPFFRALYVAFKLQSKGKRSVGGAGSRRIVWEMDDAVFMEAGGKEFMHEAISMIKGVLGFEDVALTNPPKLRKPVVQLNAKSSFSHARRYSGDVEELVPLRTEYAVGPSTPRGANASQSSFSSDLNRTRSGSDPFTDPNKSPDKRKAAAEAVGAAQSGGKRGPAPPVPAHPPGVRSTSRKGPAPAPPASRAYHSPQPMHADGNNPLGQFLTLDGREQAGASDASNPLTPTSGVDVPLLPKTEHPSMVTALEEAAEREDQLASLGYGRRNNGRSRANSDLLSDNSDSDLATRASMPLMNADEHALDDDEDEDLHEPRMRLWMMPAHLSDPELDAMMAMFPAFIKKAKTVTNIRFPLPRPASLSAAMKARDEEMGNMTPRSGEDSWPLDHGIKVPPEGAEGFIRPGTGRMWVGEAGRDAAYRGTFWERVGRWFRRLFGG